MISAKRWRRPAVLISVWMLTLMSSLGAEMDETAMTRVTIVDSEQFERFARDNVAKVLKRADVLNYTPPLPENWPPVDSVRLVVYGYAMQAAPTGMIQYLLTTPRAEIVIEVALEQMRVVETLAKEAHWLERLQPRARTGIDVEARRAGVDSLLVALRDGALDAEAERSIRLSYSSWRRENSVLASLIADRHQAFFTWLDEP